MGKIFKNLLPHWKALILITVLLVIQAACDLALPQYTSDIIDTGIQNRGIEHILPEKITDAEFRYARIFMTAGEKSDYIAAYDLKTENMIGLEKMIKNEKIIIDRKNLSEKKLSELDREMMIPLMMDYQLSRLPYAQFEKYLNGAQIPDELKSSLTHREIEMEQDGKTVKVDCIDARAFVGAIPSEKIISEMRETMEKEIKTIGTDTLLSSVKAFAAECEEQAGVDLDKKQTDYLWAAGLRMTAIALILTVAAVLVGLIAAKVGASVGMTLRSKVFRNVIGFSNAEIDKFSTASLITRTTNDIQHIQMVSVMLLRMVLYAPIIGVGGVLKVISTGASMWWVIALAVAAIITIVLTLVLVSMPKFKLMQKLVDRVNLVSREILTGIPVIRAFGREKREEERFDEANRALTKTTLFTNRVMTFMMPMMTVLMNLVSVLIVWVAAGNINEGNMQVGEMTAFITYAMQIIISFLMLTAMSIILPRAAVAANRIDEVVKTESSITEADNATELKECEGTVEFSDVSFRYPGAGENVLEKISFVAKPGGTTAIIGSTGSGKTTLVNLIVRLYDVTGGAILVDGMDIRKLNLKSLRDKIGYVPQKGVLFSGTIASNLRFGNKDATDEEIRKAAEIAQAKDFIEEKTNKYDSEISQGGTNVSGGQKQRLSIARAIAKNPKIYIFDDSFSALDMKTDAVLRKTLAENVKDSTVIIVAQRISTIMDAEQIIVLDEGKIAGIGTHSELLKSCEAYLEIARSQLSESELGLGKEAKTNG